MWLHVAEDHPDVHLEIDADELESIYGSVRIEVAAKDLHPDQIKLENKLGNCVYLDKSKYLWIFMS